MRVKILWTIITLLTLYLFSNFSTWFMWVINYIEHFVGNDPIQRLSASFMAPILAFFVSFAFCILPILIIGILNFEIFSRVERVDVINKKENE